MAVHLARNVQLAVAIAGLAAAACAGPRGSAPAATSTGAIAGLARDHTSGDPVARAEILVRAQGAMTPFTTLSSDRGRYDVRRLRPGRYSLSALFAGQPVDVANIEVRAGEITLVDVVFTLGRPDPIKIDLSRGR